MPLYELGLTQDQIMDAVKPAPEGDYLLTCDGFILYKEGTDDEDLFHPTKQGGRMVKAKFVIQSDNPKANGKRIIFNGVVGTFSFSHLAGALPFMTGTGIDTEAAIGRQIKAHVSVRTYENPETGEVTESNDINARSMSPA